MWRMVLRYAGLLGVVMAASVGASGVLYPLVLGGVSIVGSVIGTFGGVIAIQLLRKGLGHIGADTSTVNLVIGLILIAVLFLDRQLNVKGKEELKV